MHPVTAAVTARIVERSRQSRADYLSRMESARHAGAGRAKLSCANWAHAFAASPDGDGRLAASGASEGARGPRGSCRRWRWRCRIRTLPCSRPAIKRQRS